MFWFTKKPSSGSHSQCLAKITHLVPSGYIELVQDVISVMIYDCDKMICMECVNKGNANY